MAKNTSENRLTKDLRAKLNEKDRSAFLSAVDLNGVPSITIISFFISKDEESLLFAIDRDNSCYKKSGKK